MSTPELSKSVPVDELKRSRPERLYVIGSVWFASLFVGFMGLSALINPDVRIPVVDPLLEQLAAQKVQPTAPPVGKPKPAPTAIAPAPQPQPPKVTPSPTVKAVPPSPTAATPQPPAQPAAPPVTEDAISFWIYGAIIGSCLSGSTLITYSLYRLQQHRQQQKRQKLQHLKQFKRKRPKQLQRKIYERTAEVAPSPAVATATEARPVPPVVSVNPVPAHPVPEVAPLHISTPTVIAFPQVALEPVIDPEPIRHRPTKAETLAAIAQQAKQANPKRLVDAMDIRRKRRFAPLPQDL